MSQDPRERQVNCVSDDVRFSSVLDTQSISMRRYQIEGLLSAWQQPRNFHGLVGHRLFDLPK
jgi:hypothetical protein